MKVLTVEEADEVPGGSLAGNIGMTLATGWAGTVAGFAAGSIVPGVGNIAGAITGFGIGALGGVGYALASS